MPIPSKPLDPVPVSRREVERDGDALIAGDHLESRELPAEWALRELTDADLDDGEVVTWLVREYGWPVEPNVIPSNRKHAPTLDDAWQGFKIIRALTRAWASASCGEDPAGAWKVEHFEYAEPGERWNWEMFAQLVSSGLRAYAPRVDAGPHRWDEVGLYEAAMAQLYNLMAEGRKAQRCANENCRRLFVNQQGGAAFGQYRTKGVMFCTPECAHAQKQREYRRRRKAAKRKEKAS